MAPLNCSNLKPSITLDSSLSPHLYPFLTAPPPPNSLKFIYFSLYSLCIANNFLKLYLSIPVSIQYYFVLVSGVQHSGQAIVYFTKGSP